MRRQKDLFQADLHLFPLARSIEVPRMVQFLSVVPGPAGERYFARRCRELTKRLRAAGLPKMDVDAEVAMFRGAVEASLASTKAREASA